LGRGEEDDDMSKLLNILGLFANLGGVLLLFVFGMPVRVEPGGTTVTWTTSNINYQIRRFDDIYSALAWLGLGFIIFGALLQAIATLQRRK
jgi:hypothetical protein